MFLGALRKHLAISCFAMGPSERFDYFVSVFSEGSLRLFSDFLDSDISMMAIHSAKGLEWDIVFIPGDTRSDWPGAICSRCESAGMCSRSPRGCRIVDVKKTQTGLLRKWTCCTSVSLAPAKRYMSLLRCSAGQITGTIRLPAPLVFVSSGH